MTEVCRAIVLVSIIGTILDEYEEDELTLATKELRDVCLRFRDKQSGVGDVMVRDGIGRRQVGKGIVDQKKYDRYMETIKIGDRVWKGALDRYVKQSLTIDAVAAVVAVYEFAPVLLHKHARISPDRIRAFEYDGRDGDATNKYHGALIGGYLSELLAKEMGIKINGRLRAIKHKVQREVAA